MVKVTNLAVGRVRTDPTGISMEIFVNFLKPCLFFVAAFGGFLRAFLICHSALGGGHARYIALAGDWLMRIRVFRQVVLIWLSGRVSHEEHQRKNTDRTVLYQLDLLVFQLLPAEQGRW